MYARGGCLLILSTRREWDEGQEEGQFYPAKVDREAAHRFIISASIESLAQLGLGLRASAQLRRQLILVMALGESSQCLMSSNQAKLDDLPVYNTIVS